MICSNPQCFVRKDTVLSLHDLTFLLIKSIKNYKAKFSTNLILKKIDKDNFGKNHYKNHVGKHCSNLQYFKEKKYYKAKFSISSILKK